MIEPDLRTAPIPAATVSDWLRRQHVVRLADFARAARRSGGSFGRHLIGVDEPV